MQEFNFKDFGLDVGKYLETIVRVQKRILKQLKKVHYLISCNINKNSEISYYMEKLKKIEEVYYYSIRDNFLKHYGYFIKN